MTDIRRATPADTEGILVVRSAVWPNEPSNLRQIATAIQDPDHTTLVAVLEGRIVGYLDCFATAAQDGLRRWELDQLAVHPEHRRQRIGYALAAAGTKAGRERKAQVARALIQVDNVPSQQTFARCGYQPDDLLYGLYVCRELMGDPRAMPDDLHLVRVQTLSYRGFWLEGQLTHERLRAARAPTEWDLVGTLIPADRPEICYKAIDAGYDFVSDYQWWLHQL